MRRATHLFRRRGLVTALVVVALGAAAVRGAPLAISASGASVPDPTDWSPAPLDLLDLSTVATADGRGLRINTAGGVRDFVAGVDLGATTPGHRPGELEIDAETYRRWFEQMGELGIRSVRIYTIHRPVFYEELARYNEAHPTDPLYLVQGVYLPADLDPDSSTFLDPAVDGPFEAELADAVRAVHGELTRPRMPGRASGTYTTDVSRWLLAWIVGVEWDPGITVRTDRRYAATPSCRGRYVRDTPDATPTERWLACRLNGLAQQEAARGVSVPVAFVNWPTTDPLRHREPNPNEDLVGVDANHVLPTAAWPGGSFASYHAYPNYPDFLRFDSTLVADGANGADPFAAYLGDLRRHHAVAHLPVLITETGVPSSLGAARAGTKGRSQGFHTEQAALQIDADLLRLVRAQGLSGVFLFSWADEWFKSAWNTVAHQHPADRRQLWHDVLTNEQFYGLLATDPVRVPGARREVTPDHGPISSIVLDADPSYLYVDLTYRASPTPVSLRLGAPGETAGHQVDVDPATESATVRVRADLDPTRLDTDEPMPQSGRVWRVQTLVTSRSYPIPGGALGTLAVGTLVPGRWEHDLPDADSRATWYVAGSMLRMRLPLGLIGVADPSSRTVLGPGTPATFRQVDALALRVDPRQGEPVEVRYGWPTWEEVTATERIKGGAAVVAGSYRELNGVAVARG